MRPFQTITLALLLTLFFSSCATLTRGSTDTVIIRSNPSGALVTLSNGMSATTPAQFELPRKSTVLVNIRKPGFQPMDVTLNPVMSGKGGAGLAGNLLAGGFVGAAVDANTGAFYDLTPNPLHVNLIPLNGEAGSYDESFDIPLDTYAYEDDPYYDTEVIPGQVVPAQAYDNREVVPVPANGNLPGYGGIDPSNSGSNTIVNPDPQEPGGSIPPQNNNQPNTPVQPAGTLEFAPVGR